MVSQEVFHSVVEELRRIEAARGVRVLYACESGSRAWGFASRDSDYDVRFLYVHERDWYLSISDRRDVIEEPISDDLDVSGWELRKALRLLRKSNPPLLEWLKSPVVYAQDEAFAAEFRELAAGYYSPMRCFKHYLHMAYGNARDYLKGDTVWLKKYLYVLRPLLACQWIERGMGEPPMLFDELVAGLVEDSRVLAAIERLLEMKRSGDELDRSPHIEELTRFITVELARLDELELPNEAVPSDETLNAFFRRYCLADSVAARIETSVA
jgi:predicted nucleotidyltransferase